MGTANWGTWTPEPAAKTASARVPFTEYNSTQDNISYLLTGLQNTALGHAHNGHDSPLLVTPPVTSYVSVNQTIQGDYSTVPGWSAVLTATASAMLRFSIAAGILAYDFVDGSFVRAAVITASASGTASALGAAIAQPTYWLGINDYHLVAYQWWTGVPSGLIKVLGQVSGSAIAYNYSIEADLRQTG